MDLTLEIPDDIARQMHLDGPEAQRRVLIKLAVASYRAGELSRGQVGALLNLSFGEIQELLKEHKCPVYGDMTVEDFQREFEQAQAYLKR